MNHADVVIVGAGPIGLCFARALATSGLTIALVDRQPSEHLATPVFDGREIALTHASRALLEALGIWPLIPGRDIHPLREAKVLNGPSAFSLDFAARPRQATELGWLVPNQQIRRAAWTAADGQERLRLIDGVSVNAIETRVDDMQVTLSDGRLITTQLVVAADNRFSAIRRLLGIGASVRDFGRSMLVCRMRHERDHAHTAVEWFGYGKTLALLPLDEKRSSAVVTLPPHRIEALMAMAKADFDASISALFEHRFGAMQADGERHAYPLVSVYANRFVGPRSALIGDAAVGMHPVTAHGFNLGLQSVERLSSALRGAAQGGGDIGEATLLAAYERDHRLVSRPLYEATNAIVSLYTDDRLPLRLLRNAALRVAQHLPPFKGAVTAHLTRTR
ncbi:5-demethoxyubiquinol-8 5-hydroxylase UbiM [Pseudomonas matsuisoli]|uniref:FAD-binding domain-containing protein n=1 Tax=Pseudomonas matsuisoli TaxID=1515666 RepID=A0A917Q1A2_9PSED|nr:5-demethoxyubiquinol-8 5-hydroxylase UbiM [Pseudomonas matsuisoli]GGK05060.1 hypothetical protein GCM10009304_34010 [Pseudomonas matsuisoli]